MSYLATLQNAIRKMHGCDSQHVESVPITETFQGKTVWEGTVEVFELQGHSKAKRCYAWGHRKDDGGERYVAVLELPPVDSPRKAVQAAVATELREQTP